MTLADPSVLDLVRRATDILATQYAAKVAAHPDFDADGFFFDLRRSIEARAKTLDDVSQFGAMGGGGADEA